MARNKNPNPAQPKAPAPSSSLPTPSVVPSKPKDTMEVVVAILRLHSPRTAGQKGGTILPDFGLIRPLDRYPTVEDLGRQVLDKLFTPGGDLRPVFCNLINTLAETSPLSAAPDSIATICFRLGAVMVFLNMPADGPTSR